MPHLLHICVFFLSKYWSVTHFFSCSQLQESSFVFKVNLKGLLLPKIIFSVATSELAIYRSCVTICFYILRLHRQVFFSSSCSEYFQEIPRKTSATELIFSLVMSFQYTLYWNDFLGISWNFLGHLFRTPFNAWW